LQGALSLALRKVAQVPQLKWRPILWLACFSSEQVISLASGFESLLLLDEACGVMVGESLGGGAAEEEEEEVAMSSSRALGSG